MADNTKIDREDRAMVKTLRARADAARDSPTGTDPASRHVQMMGEILGAGKPYPMLDEEPAHCAISMLATVASLWELRAEHNREVERRRKAEADIDAMIVCAVRYCIGRQSYIVGTCDSWLRDRWPSLSNGTRDVIVKDIRVALEQERLGHRSLGMQMDIDTWAALYRDMSPGGCLASRVPA